ncbi:hypothetical protein M3J09_005094 [Ascochyta lentis]
MTPVAMWPSVTCDAIFRPFSCPKLAHGTEYGASRTTIGRSAVLRWHVISQSIGTFNPAMHAF